MKDSIKQNVYSNLTFIWTSSIFILLIGIYAISSNMNQNNLSFNECQKTDQLNTHRLANYLKKL